MTEKIKYFDDAINKILPHLEKYKNYPHLEVEFRLGFLEDDDKFFNTSIPKEFFEKIAKVLKSNKNWKSQERTVVNDFFNKGLRMSVYSDGKRECIKKNKFFSMDFTFEYTPFDLRVSISQELPKSISEFIIDDTDTNSIFKREKDRMSYVHKIWSFDITSVKTTDNSVEDTSFEIELDTTNFSKNKPSCLKYYIHSSLLKIKDLVDMCEKVPDEAELVFIQEKCFKIS